MPTPTTSAPRGPRDVWEDERVVFVRCAKLEDGGFEACILFTFSWKSRHLSHHPAVSTTETYTMDHDRLAGRGLGGTANEAVRAAYGDGLIRMEALGESREASVELSMRFQMWNGGWV